MNEILTNEEIDILLQMFRSEGGAVEEPGSMASAPAPVVAHDDRFAAAASLCPSAAARSLNLG